MKQLARGILRLAGLDVYRARGGVFLCPRPRAGEAADPKAFPSPLRLNLGCGNKRLEGHFNIDIVATPATDLACDITRLPMFADGTAEEIRLEAVYEHLFRHERLAAIREWFRVLKPGGRLRVDWIPDFDAVAGRYVRREPGLSARSSISRKSIASRTAIRSRGMRPSRSTRTSSRALRSSANFARRAT